MVHDIAGDERALPLRLDQYADVARRVARRRLQANLRCDDVVHLDLLNEARVEDRLHGVGEHRLLLVVGRVAEPVLELRSREQIRRAREGGHPAVSFAHGVPADVVDVQMRADYGVDRFAPEAGRLERAQEATLQGAPARQATRLVVADAGVDHQPQPGRLHDQRVDREDQVALGRGEVRRQPRDRAHCVGRRLRDHRHVRAIGRRHFGLDDARDLDRADLPALHHAGCTRCARRLRALRYVARALRRRAAGASAGLL
jgi:hypothetical protein